MNVLYEIVMGGTSLKCLELNWKCKQSQAEFWKIKTLIIYEKKVCKVAGPHQELLV